jgi:hypothetical protein
MSTENLKERDEFGYLGIAGRMIKWNLTKECPNMWGLYVLFQDRDQWRTLVNMKTKLRD